MTKFRILIATIALGLIRLASCIALGAARAYAIAILPFLLIGVVSALADGITGTMQLTSAMICTALGACPASSALTSGHVYVGNGSNVAADTAPGTGLAGSSSGISSNAAEHVSFQPGLMTAVSNAKSAFYKYSKASTVDNLEASAQQFSCTGNPTITMYECGTSTTCASPTTIGSTTVTAAGTVVDGTVSSAAIPAGDYVAFAVSAGTCVTLDINMTAQVHSN